jgi:O-antigen/teichoic acid export membrane protein
VFAIYRYGAKELPFVVVAANALSIASIPMLADGKLASFNRLRTDSLRMMKFLFPLTAVLLITSQWFYPLLFNAEFHESHLVFNLYLLLIVSRLIFPQSICNALRKTRIILYSAFTEITINVLLSLVLIQYWGIVGVAFASVVASFVDKIFLLSYLHFKLKIQPSDYIPLRQWSLFSVAIISIYVLITFVRPLI